MNHVRNMLLIEIYMGLTLVQGRYCEFYQLKPLFWQIGF